MLLPCDFIQQIGKDVSMNQHIVGNESRPPCFSAPKTMPLAPSAFPPPRETPPMQAGVGDRLFAFLALGIGYGFLCFFTAEFSTQPAYLFTPCYVLCVLGYGHVKKIKPSRESWFWLVVVLSLGVGGCWRPYGLPDWYYANLLGPLWSPLLQGVAAYWTLSVLGGLQQGKTSSWLLADTLNASLILPYGNFFCLPRVLFQGVKDTGSGKKLLGVGIGLVLTLPVLCLVLPLLAQADENFAFLLVQLLQGTGEDFSFHLFRILFSLPVSCYLFGLWFGASSGRRMDCLTQEKVHRAKNTWGIASPQVFLPVLSGVCLSYVLFMVLQGSYLFSGFTGTLPEDFTYAEYAREGFFQLCGISAGNLLLLLGVHLFTKGGCQASPWLKGLSVALCACTLLLLSTAASKMGMYLLAYGLTPLRLVSTAFLLWLFTVFTLAILWLGKGLSPARPALLTAGALAAVLAWIRF